MQLLLVDVVPVFQCNEDLVRAERGLCFNAV
jgi:hypothetical protein